MMAKQSVLFSRKVEEIHADCDVEDSGYNMEPLVICKATTEVWGTNTYFSYENLFA